MRTRCYGLSFSVCFLSSSDLSFVKSPICCESRSCYALDAPLFPSFLFVFAFARNACVRACACILFSMYFLFLSRFHSRKNTLRKIMLSIVQRRARLIDELDCANSNFHVIISILFVPSSTLTSPESSKTLFSLSNYIVPIC